MLLTMIKMIFKKNYAKEIYENSKNPVITNEDGLRVIQISSGNGKVVDGRLMIGGSSIFYH